MEKHVAQFAPVAPVQILQRLIECDPRQGFGNYHLFLAHHTVERRDQFTTLMKSRQQGSPWDQLTIIMDNSLVELKGAVDFDMIKDAVQIVSEGPNLKVIPVLPDVMGNGRDTITLSGAAYQERWYKKMPGDSFMLVAQGADWTDFTSLVNYFFIENRERFMKIGWVGIPRKLVETLGSRMLAIDYIRMVAPEVKIHLLGFSDRVLDDILCARKYCVQGIDSAVPVRHPGAFLPTSKTPPRDPEWFDRGELSLDACRNIRNVRKWIMAER